MALSLAATMSSIIFNSDRGQMEAHGEGALQDGRHELLLMVPPFMSDCDRLTPLQLGLASGQTCFLFGRYCRAKDMIVFALAGPKGYEYKLSFEDGNRPYGWKVKKHGRVQSGSLKPSLGDHIVAFLCDKAIALFSGDGSVDYVRDLIEADTWACEEGVSLPMAMLRLAHRHGILDSREQAVGPWSFYGPSLPGAFLRCRLKIKVHPPGQQGSFKDVVQSSTATMGRLDVVRETQPTPMGPCTIRPQSIETRPLAPPPTATPQPQNQAVETFHFPVPPSETVAAVKFGRRSIGHASF